ncbi:uncharacterized protein J3D65DRAFT_682203, partial [Phyllosticta citribraziliensis]
SPQYQSRIDIHISFVRGQPHTLLHSTNVLENLADEDAILLVGRTDSLNFRVRSIRQDDLVRGPNGLDTQCQLRRVEDARNQLNVSSVVGSVDAAASGRAFLGCDVYQSWDADTGGLATAARGRLVVPRTQKSADANEIAAGLRAARHLVSNHFMCVCVHVLVQREHFLLRQSTRASRWYDACPEERVGAWSGAIGFAESVGCVTCIRLDVSFGKQVCGWVRTADVRSGAQLRGWRDIAVICSKRIPTCEQQGT